MELAHQVAISQYFCVKDYNLVSRFKFPLILNLKENFAKFIFISTSGQPTDI